MALRSPLLAGAVAAVLTACGTPVAEETADPPRPAPATSSHTEATPDLGTTEDDPGAETRAPGRSGSATDLSEAPTRSPGSQGVGVSEQVTITVRD